MRLSPATGIALATLLVLAGCGGGAPSGNSSETGAVAGPAAPGGGGLLGARWKGDEACTTISKETVTKATGIEVTETKLDGVYTTKDSPSDLSSCYYTLKTGEMLAVLTKMSPDQENTAEAMKAMRDGTAAMMGPAENVAGVGKGAFWLPKARQLNAFVGKDRYFNVTVPADLGGKDPKAVALAIGSELD